MNERRPHGRFNRSVAGSQRQTTAFVRWRINGHRTAYIGFNLDTWAGIVAPTGNRAEADECRRMATKALDPVDRERRLRVASQWLELIPNHSTDVSVVRALTTPEHPEKRPGYLAS
jgi:hypothetical protein